MKLKFLLLILVIIGLLASIEAGKKDKEGKKDKKKEKDVNGDGTCKGKQIKTFTTCINKKGEKNYSLKFPPSSIVPEDR